MIIYQVLCTVPRSLEEEWRLWMMEEHIRDVMNTEMFDEVHIARVLKPEHPTAVRYCIQYYAPTVEHYEQYRKDFAPVLQAAHNAKYGGMVEIERTVMEIVPMKSVSPTQ
ncbi:MAG: DUF4286 family protein [Bacteroidota bacterium]|nr:DUF4286 family protein [Candidatus Kapabacteria bacterium]MCS7302525.1 DUF4286 family protein [Candidatus Kapabacteria bacterium]MCX7936789.1 DUF4286 family protein [Chlorobiota bacterium]MDW8074167.1 DUF4286 family protein [Bacteroidota bacterium]MDW8271357.1 DUF4286 family protein [Bacteroidota bacterium]